MVIHNILWGDNECTELGRTKKNPAICVKRQRRWTIALITGSETFTVASLYEE